MQKVLSKGGTARFANRLKNVSLAAVIAASSVGAAVSPLFLSSAASAAPSTVVVTPTDKQGWSDVSTPGGTVTFVSDAAAPAGSGALQLSEPAGDNNGEAEFDRNTTPTPVSSLANLSYYSKKVAGDPTYVAPAYILGIDLNGTAGTDTTNDFYAFYEPVYNDTSSLDFSQWQQFTVDPAASKLWSFSPLGSSTTLGGANGANFFTLADVAKAFPNAKVNELTLNLGSGTPGWTAEADNVSLNDTTWNFEATAPAPAPATPQTRDDCKNDGWKTFTSPKFRNQGECVSYVERHSHEVNGDIAYTAGNLKRQAWFHMDTASGRGWFVYADANHDWYGVRVSSVKVDGNTAWFAGQVDRSRDHKFNGNWLFAKVTDGKPDQIWGSFTTQAAALTGVQAKTDPTDGPFTVTRGNLHITR